ncbi:DUF1657 domain-containing protein [Desulfallas sp. Bu1-1]|uniref:DUF1657 domain-containing protein n=1 Tax=Desulfallas sp. Bu1-1 TaxID=2787620 RepID=UPI00189D53BA|nr:DUF1657 domain-containing protein [Desulfallas sp. Bu1-1]MBF7084580.1 DUF1657 domain-containing protein [Desulfallas sp. Bu1-1]
MTVGGQVKQTIAGLKGARVTLEQIASMEKNPEAKETLERNTGRIDAVINNLEKRLGVLEFEEPQYKGF